MANNNDYIISINPATEQEIGKTPKTKIEDIKDIVKKSKEAEKNWGNFSFSERGKYLLKAREYILDNMDEIAETITKDNGKPLVEALTADIFGVCDLIYYFAKKSRRILGKKHICLGIWNLFLRSSYIIRKPFGVTFVISPWNFPFAIPMGEIVMALAAGNTVIHKPSSATMLVGMKIDEVFKNSGMPENVFTTIVGGASEGEEVIKQGVDKILFTGSTGVGARIMELASKNITPLNLELGGKDPFIVLEDADIKTAAKGAVWGAFTNCGQVCASAERIFVHEAIANVFTGEVKKITQQLKQGNGLDFDTDVGPLTTKGQLENTIAHVDDAKNNNVNILAGGEKKEGPGFFYPPTIIKNPPTSLKCIKEETFGPTLPIIKFKTDEEAIKLANDSDFGLCGSVWSKNIKRAKNIASKLETGTVTINETTYTHALCRTPWGGIKKSGFGRSHANIGLLEMTYPLHIHINRIYLLPSIWWFGYSKKMYDVFKKITRYMTGSVFGKILAIPHFIRAILLKKY